MYRYRLNKENESNRMSVNGIVLFKEKWFTAHKVEEKLNPFLSILDFEEFDELKEFEEKLKVEKEVEQEIIQPEEIKVTNTRVEVKSIFHDTEIEEILTNEEKRNKYRSMTNTELLKTILESDPIYKKDDFKGCSKQSLLQTIYNIKKL